MSGASHDGREHGSGSVISGKSGFTHTGSIVDYKSSYVFITHVCWLLQNTKQGNIIIGTIRNIIVNFNHEKTKPLLLQPNMTKAQEQKSCRFHIRK